MRTSRPARTAATWFAGLDVAAAATSPPSRHSSFCEAQASSIFMRTSDFALDRIAGSTRAKSPSGSDVPVWTPPRPPDDRLGVIPSLTMDRVLFAEPMPIWRGKICDARMGHGHPSLVASMTTPEPFVSPSLDASTEALGEQIAALAARLHAATYELLVLLHEFDDRIGWNGGFASCAHWLHWRTGIDLGAGAREDPCRPRTGGPAAVERDDATRGDFLRQGPGADPGGHARQRGRAAGSGPGRNRCPRRTVRPRLAARRSGAAAAQAESRHLHRQLSTWIDDDGMVVIRGRLTPEVGAVVQRVLEAANDRLLQGSATSKAESLTDEVAGTAAGRRPRSAG